jgi:hypothetical protein
MHAASNFPFRKTVLHVVIAGTLSAALAACGGGGGGGNGITLPGEAKPTAVPTPVPTLAPGALAGSTDAKIGSIAAGLASISANANTTIEVVVTDKTTGKALSGEIVSFTSRCAAAGKATIDAKATTDSNGKAIAAFTDKGCGNTDTVTATLSNGQAASTQISIAPPTATSLVFTTIIPSDGVITLKGYGTASRPDTAQVSFKLVDAIGTPISGQAVTFSLDVSVGGVALQNATGGVVTATTDGNGIASVTVLAGNQPTPVRVTAKSGALISTSGKLAISSGFPDQDSTSFAADKYNINGWNIDGAKASITMRFADHFNNPIPDGTAINFITDSGKIGTGTQGSCSTSNSACVIELESQGTRPTSGRVHVLAYAVGEESFVDKNNSIVADQANELVDINGVSSDLGEAFVDVNENGVFDLGIDQLVDFNSDKQYNGPDGKFNGTLCAPGFALCSSQKTLNIFRQATFIFSSEVPRLVNYGTVQSPKLKPELTSASSPTVPTTFNQKCGVTEEMTAYIPDENGNPLPAGTVISFIAPVSNSGYINDKLSVSFTVPSTNIPANTAKLGTTLFKFNFGYGGGDKGCTSGSINLTIAPPAVGSIGGQVQEYSYPFTITP